MKFILRVICIGCLSLFLFTYVTAQDNLIPINTFDWSPDGTRLAIGRTDGTFEIFNIETNEVEYSRSVANIAVTSVAWNPINTSKIAFTVSIGGGGGVGVIDINNSQQTVFFDTVVGMMSLAWSPDGTQLTGAGKQSSIGGMPPNVVMIWDATTGTLLKTLVAHSDTVTNVDWSPDGTRIVTGAADKKAIIWDVRTGSSMFTVETHEDGVSSVAWNSDGSLIAIASRGYVVESEVYIWDSVSGQLVNLPLFQGQDIDSVSWHPANPDLLAVANSEVVIISDIQMGSILQQYQQTNVVSEIKWSPDGSNLAILHSPQYPSIIAQPASSGD